MSGAAIGDASTPGLEPGLQRLIRLLITVQLFGIAFVRRTLGASVGIDMPLVPYLAVTLPVPLLLFAMVWFPSWEGRRGRLLLPVIVVLESITLIGDKFVTLVWLIDPAQREMDGLLLFVRVWMFMHVLTLVVAWQYSWRAAGASAFALIAVDFLLSTPFVHTGDPYFRLFVVLSVTRTMTVGSVAMGIGWLLQRQREQKAALAMANQALADYAATTGQLAVSRERNRLARELHDTLAHSLSAVTVQIEAIRALWDVNADSARTMLDSALHNARSGLTEARRALHALRASPLDAVGLSEAIGDLARSAAARANLQMVLNAPSAGLGIRADQEQVLYRVAQEAVANVVRHARATELRVMLERSNGHLVLTVVDNGVGFDRGAVDMSAHFGLSGMQERVTIGGGELSVASTRGRGTTVRAAVPVNGAP